MKRCRTRGCRAVVAVSVISLLCAAAPAPVPAKQDDPVIAQEEADSEIGSLLTHIERILMQEETGSAADLNQLLLAAVSIYNYASPKGQERLIAFPDQLNHRAAAERASGQPDKAGDIADFLQNATPFLDKLTEKRGAPAQQAAIEPPLPTPPESSDSPPEPKPPPGVTAAVKPLQPDGNQAAPEKQAAIEPPLVTPSEPSVSPPDPKPSPGVTLVVKPPQPDGNPAAAMQQAAIEPPPVTPSEPSVSPPDPKPSPVVTAPIKPPQPDGNRAAAMQQAAIERPVLTPPEASVSPPDPKPSPVVTPALKPPQPEKLAEAKAFMARGDQMLDLGDLSAARLFYERAAQMGLGAAASRMGDTYDAAFLKQHNLIGPAPDPTKAAEWHKKAEAMGVDGPTARLTAGK